MPIRNSSLDDLVNPIANVIRRDVITGVSFEEATESILQAITDKELGLEQWASQIARDALNQASGITHDEVRKEFNMKWITYVPGIKNTTRPICYHFVEKLNGIIKYEDLQKELNKFVPNGIPSDARTKQTANGEWQKRGNGIIPGTNDSNFLIRRGGYNCRHEAIPTSRKPLN